MLPQAHYLVENTLCNFPLRGFRNFDNFLAADDGDRIAARIEPQPSRETSLTTMASRFFDTNFAVHSPDILRLRRKAHNNLRAFLAWKSPSEYRAWLRARESSHLCV